MLPNCSGDLVLGQRRQPGVDMWCYIYTIYTIYTPAAAVTIGRHLATAQLCSSAPAASDRSPLQTVSSSAGSGGVLASANKLYLVLISANTWYEVMMASDV